jgi:hypothetical protein
LDIRIGVLHNPKELNLDLGDVDREAVKSEIDGALAGPVSVLWLTDKDGRSVGVPTDRIAYVEVGKGDASRKIGFAPER